MIIILYMRKFILFFISIFYVLTPSWSGEKISSQHEAGIQITGYYSYDEPHLMYNRSYLGDYLLDNFGLVYNFKQQRIIDDYLYEFEIDTDYKRFNIDYWSNATGNIDDAKNEIFNLRLLGGIQLTDNVKLKSGYGYRYIEDHKDGLITTTGALAYDRIQVYQYIPLLAEIKAPVGSLDGTLKLEYDYIYYGKNESKLSQSGGSDLEFRNDDGYMVKASYKFPYLGFNFEPYYIFQSIEESNVAENAFEPSNTTNEYGLKFTKVFGEELAITNPFKTPISGSTDIYFGAGMMFTKVDTGYEPITATLDEKNIGYKIFAGLPVSDKIDIEFAYNNFGEAVLSGNNGDSFVDPGKFNHGQFSSGSTLNFTADGAGLNIRSESTSVEFKPKINTNNFEIIPMIGFHKWDQSEILSFTGSSSGGNTADYTDVDLIYGIGLKAKTQSNLIFSLNYAEYPMYYDASAIGLNLEYKF